MTDDFDAALTALLASPEDSNADAFAEDVIRRLDRRDAIRKLVLGGAGTAGLAVFAWQFVARFEVLGAALHALLDGVTQSVEIGSAVLIAVLLASMLGGGARRSGAR